MYAIAEEVERLVFAFGPGDDRREAVRDLAKRVDAAVKTARRAGEVEAFKEAAKKARESKHLFANAYPDAPVGWDEADDALEELAVALLAQAEEALHD